MGKGSAIQWTDDTDNIIVVDGGGWWCRMISPGCANCYAATLNKNSMYGGNGLAYTGEPPKLKLREDMIAGWARQKNPKKHFVSSMTDVFGDWVPYEWVEKFLDGMRLAPKQTFQVLTKRADIARQHISLWLQRRNLDKLPKNIWIGVSVENQEWYNKRVNDLFATPAHVRFLSCEPLLGPIDLGLTWKLPQELQGKTNGGIHWVIVGGESGKKARPMHPDWAYSLRDQCVEAEVPFFFKQWGEWVPFGYDGFNQRGTATVLAVNNDGVAGTPTDELCVSMAKVGKIRAGRDLGAREWNEFPV